jgi:alpha-ketoglutarate-dependent taurine dioxygenase
MISEPLFSSDLLPLLVMPSEDESNIPLEKLVAPCKETLQARLTQHGAVLFRGFPLHVAADFQACVELFGAKSYSYVGGNSPRTKVLNDVYTSTEYPATEMISLHHEMSYSSNWPARLFFFCEIPAARGGETSLASSREVTQAIPDDIEQKFREKGLQYVRHFRSGMNIGKSWQATYQTEDRDELEDILRSQRCEFTWDSRGNLSVVTRCNAYAPHPRTGKELWFNQAEQWHPSALNPQLRTFFETNNMLAHDCRYGDGEPIADETLTQVRNIINSKKLLFPWQKKDLLVIDNMLMMHGRESYAGARKTLAFLSST